MDKNEAEGVIRDTIEYADKEIKKNKKKTAIVITAVIILTVLVAAASLIIVLNRPAGKSADMNVVREYSQNEDGAWECEGNVYKYRLEITGRMPNAVKDSVFVYLSNSEDVTFEQAWKAAGFSSNLEDYFDPSETILVETSK